MGKKRLEVSILWHPQMGNKLTTSAHQLFSRVDHTDKIPTGAVWFVNQHYISTRRGEKYTTSAHLAFLAMGPRNRMYEVSLASNFLLPVRH